MTFGIAIAVLCILAGLLVGIASSMFGIGGGVVMVPFIRLALGEPPSVTSATALFATLPTAISGAWRRGHSGSVNVKVGVVVGAVGMCISPIGARLSMRLPGWIGMVLAAAIILFFALRMYRKARAMSPDGKREAEKRETALGVRQWIAPSIAGAFAGMCSGYLGLSGGFIIVPVLQGFMGMDMKESSGTSLVAVALLGIPGLITHILGGNVAYLIGICLIIGSLPGTFIGSWLVTRVNNQRLTYAFSILLVISGVLLAARELLF